VGERRPRLARVRVHDDGSVTFVDPDPTLLPVIREFRPSFSVGQEPLSGFVHPRLMSTLTTGSGLSLDELAPMSIDSLWQRHDALSSHANAERPPIRGEASLMDIKVRLARLMLKDCTLCGVRCRIDRSMGERGRCGLGEDAYVYEAYTHIAEEPPINPSFNISLRGCGLRCRFCQQFDALQPRGAAGDRLLGNTWTWLDLSSARSLTFVGGNPTESLPSILEFLKAAPDDFALPIAWNSAGYDSVEALSLLDGVCDAYVPDWKYGNDLCATRLSNAAHYTSIASVAIAEMCRQGVPVFVRMLVLPGHVECCHIPSLDLLAPWRSAIQLNVLAQYMPDFLVGPVDGRLAGDVTPDEMARVRRAAAARGFEVMSPAER
jgi:uncharacterized Fe-S radical SAM superfamily protein PflX